MNCACVVFKTSGTWSKTGKRKDTFLHHSVLPLFLSLHLLPLLYLEILPPHNLSILLIQVLGNHCKIQLTFVALGGPLTTWFFLVPLCTAELPSGIMNITLTHNCYYYPIKSIIYK